MSIAARRRTAMTTLSLSSSSFTAAKVCAFLSDAAFSVTHLRTHTDARKLTEALKQLLVILRTPSPSPEPTPEPTPESEEALIDGLTAAQHTQIQNLVRQLASENASSAKTGDNVKKIKQEIAEGRGLNGRSGHASKKAKNGKRKAKVVVIDDSDSDDEDSTPAPGRYRPGLFVD
jgi:hypothetical protein